MASTSSLHRGKIHGILGENGAGKSTLMKMLIGLVLPDAGEIRIDGRPCQIHDPLTAASLGFGMVHQHFSLVDALTVWETSPSATQAASTLLGFGNESAKSAITTAWRLILTPMSDPHRRSAATR